MSDDAASRSNNPEISARLAELDLRLKSIEKDYLPKYEHKFSYLEEEFIVPRFLQHVPLDYGRESHELKFGENIHMAGETLPLPPRDLRGGYTPEDDAAYLKNGLDHKRIVNDLVDKYWQNDYRPASLMDFGCYTGRVLRHFIADPKWRGSQFYGCDVQAQAIYWLRKNCPDAATFFTTTFSPHIPLPDNSVDVVYGISVFTHIKYLWDAWLLEFRRILKPGGIMVQTAQTERAWEFYHRHRNEGWVSSSHPKSMLDTPQMPEDYFLYGYNMVSQVFFKRAFIEKDWGHYIPVCEVFQTDQTFQDFVVLRKPK